MAGDRTRMFKVELYVEVPDSIVPPSKWDWSALVNPEDETPVHFQICTEVQKGTS